MAKKVCRIGPSLRKEGVRYIEMSVENKSSRGGAAAAEAALVVVINIHTTNNDGWMAPVKKQKTKLFFIASNVTSHIRL